MSLEDKIELLFEVTELTQQFENIAASMLLGLEDGGDPELNTFIESYFATTILPKIRKEMVIMFSQLLEEQDIDNLIAFWKTNSAQKYLKLLPVMSQRMGDIGEEIVKEYCSEYVIDNEFRKWQKFKSKNSQMLN